MKTTSRMLLLLVTITALAACGSPEGGGEAGGAAQAQSDVHPGEKNYNSFCFSCHAAGVAGAPRLGDVEAWAPRIAMGRDALLATTIAGIPPGMPAKGMCMTCTDEQLLDVIDYMIEKSQ